MTNEQIAMWVTAAFAAMKPFYATARHPSGWPRPGKAGQGAATAWAWGIFAQAAADAIGQTATPHELRVVWGHANHHAAKAAMLRQFWGDAPTRTHFHRELVADMTVLDWRHQRPIRASAESEVYAWHGVGASPDDDNGYAKDFMKLLLLPSPRRLFVARVGADDTDWGSARRDVLTASLTRMLTSYPALLPASDQLGIVLIPEEEAGDGPNTWRDLRTGVWTGQAFQVARPWAAA